MIDINLLEIAGFRSAVHAMRNPMNSWEKSDSMWITLDEYDDNMNASIGENDLKLMKKLNRAGVEHRTWARMVQVWADWNAPLYFWKEADRYTVGKNQISCSTMHKIADHEFTESDFSIENIRGVESIRAMQSIINALNRARESYISEDNEIIKKSHWNDMIQILPSSYNQKRTVNMSYEVLLKMHRERRHHKLSEWHTVCDWIENLPYMGELL